MINIFNIKEVSSEDVRPLRHTILRPNQDFSITDYPNDNDTSTFHLGLFAEDVLVGIASFYERNLELEASSGIWRLRGMAIDPDFQKMNLGSKLLEYAENKLKGQDFIWCNARVSAIPFYTKMGFEKISEVFEIEDIGPHFNLKKSL